ncbi:heterokaryon incompatibility protein-domain-containing protein [Zychaea mexicana]|uniref:heterokaryon incompatibility protein-domain-containing protein n=1 Tax=Zychaea mexicana TaxID=64656 RepID=UPI0022FF3140|nr:heterokaryon incompatibility protein-domain-containing protein [Zychaea mexicana]KAI9484861.1 heterokaryon incompatibility protein-domain-containing protein [Zychaea mexicana]
MYMTYVSGQASLVLDGSSKAFIKFQDSFFRPTWLVRVSDMQRVPGREAAKSYCALSYPWSYSGDIIQDTNGKSTFIDRGKHKLVLKNFPSNGGNKSGKRQQTSNHSCVDVQYVKFESIIQQLCKDRRIEYIWYDKICIDQDDKKARLAEIKQMHKIYSHADFTVALIPEMKIPEELEGAAGAKRLGWRSLLKYETCYFLDEGEEENTAYEQCMEAIQNSEWAKRMWTLEEAMVSRKIVCVGQNAHLWVGRRLELLLHLSDSSPETVFRLFTFYRGHRTANVALHHAHLRTTTKEHDRVFALVNMFADVIKVDVDYDLPVKTAILNFYGKLAMADLTILCFGKPAEYMPYHSTVRQQYEYLPSWTGIQGTHVYTYSYPLKMAPAGQFKCITQGRQMHLQCGYIRVFPKQYSQWPSLEKSLQWWGDAGGLDFTHYLTELDVDTYHKGKDVAESKQDTRSAVATRKRNVSSFFRIGDSEVKLMSLTEDCDECVVLDISFSGLGTPGMFSRPGYTERIFPVIKYDHDGAWKSIGLLFLENHKLWKKRRGLSKLAKNYEHGSFVIE